MLQFMGLQIVGHDLATKQEDDGHESQCYLEDNEGQGSLVCYSSWGRKESDMT